MLDQISHYQLINKLGAGGMGEVWLAEDTRLKRKVALKLLPAELTADADRVRRFKQEAQAASALNHPNIITLYDIGESEAGRFIVMELVAGRTLREVSAEDNSLETLLALSQQIAKALDAAHAAGITHRDIKPDNIMVRDDGYVKLLDFGIARLLPAHIGDTAAATLTQQTRPGTLLGTVAYMSPEQARGETVGYPSDIFALGIVLYELATGQHPFKAETLVGYLHAITLQTPAPPQQWQPGIPAALNAVLLRMLEKEASQRPTASEVAQTLQAIERLRDSVTAHANAPLILTPHPTPSISFTPIRHTVGREPERNELRAAFNAAKNGRGSLVCVAGEPGIGKTTLVEDFLAELAAENQATLARGRCSERLAGTEAYLPLLEALEALLRQADTHSLARTMKPGDEVLGGMAQLMRRIAATWYAQVAPLSAPLSAENFSDTQLLAEVKGASQERMKRELANFLQAIVERRPLVLFFDDLHWADVSTIDLLSFLAGKFDELKVLIVVTYRPSDMLLAKHPFLQIKPDLQSRGLCRELALEFLSEAEIAEYLALEFPGHRFPPAFSRLIHAKTEGSPLFMADLVRYLCDRGVIRKADPSPLPLETETMEAFATRPLMEDSAPWMLAETLPDIERTLPESVRGMIERKIAQLSEEDRKLLSAASVQGYEFDSAVVAQVLSLDANEIEERLEKLERVFAFVKLTSEAEFPNGTLTLRYRFVHVLYQNALYAELRATRKATLSRDVAQALEACYGARNASVANELALLWEAARDYARASDSFWQAARNAAQVHAHREAVQLARRGLATLGKLPETPERDGGELGLQLTLGFSLQSVQSWTAPEAGAAFNRAKQLCEQAGSDPRLFAALSGVWPYHALQAEFDAAQRVGEQMLQLAEQAQDPVLLVRVFMCQAFVHYYQGELVSAREDGKRALALDRRAYHAAYLSVSNENLGITTRRHQSYCLWTLGYADSALALAREAVTLANQTTHPFSLAGAHLATAMVFHTRRNWPSSQQEFEQVLALAEEYDLGDMLNYAAAFNTLTLAYQEPTAAALERAQQAIAALRGKGVTLALTAYLGILGEVFGLADRCVEGLAVIAEALAQVERTGERVWEAELWRIKGELLLPSASDHTEANEAIAEVESCYRKAIEVARRQSAKAWELRATMSLARLWQRQGKTAEARQILAEIYDWFTEGFDTADLKDARALLDALQS
ncbi:MAG: protein kinase [Acidobacteria bacterium]|nr:protein kinase [Acidobacteriota bacterium]